MAMPRHWPWKKDVGSDTAQSAPVPFLQRPGRDSPVVRRTDPAGSGFSECTTIRRGLLTLLGLITMRFSCARAKRSVSAATAGYAAVHTVPSARQGLSKTAGERGKGDRGSPGGAPGPDGKTLLEGTAVESSARTERNRALDRPGAWALRGRAGQPSRAGRWRRRNGAKRRRETNAKAAWRAERSDEARYVACDGAKTT